MGYTHNSCNIHAIYTHVRVLNTCTIRTYPHTFGRGENTSDFLSLGGCIIAGKAYTLFMGREFSQPKKESTKGLNKMTEKKVSKLSRENTPANDGVTFTYADGVTNVVMLSQFSASMKDQLACHGLKAKVGDTVADKTITGELVPIAVDAVITQLLDDVFNRGGGGGGNGGDIVAAIATLKGRTLEEAMAFWAAADDDTQKAIRKNVKVKAEVARIKQVRAEAAASTGEDDGLGF